MFKSLNQSSRILCLGSGPAAEVTALIDGSDFATGGHLHHPYFSNWLTKELDQGEKFGCRPGQKEFKKSGLVDIQTRTGDLLNQSVIDYLKTRAGRYDIVLLPSSITEMSGNSRFPALVDALRSLVDAGSRLALLDHDIPGFKSSVEPLLAGFMLSPVKFRRVRLLARDQTGGLGQSVRSWFKALTFPQVHVECCVEMTTRRNRTYVRLDVWGCTALVRKVSEVGFRCDSTAFPDGGRGKDGIESCFIQ